MPTTADAHHFIDADERKTQPIQRLVQCALKGLPDAEKLWQRRANLCLASSSTSDGCVRGGMYPPYLGRPNVVVQGLVRIIMLFVPQVRLETLPSSSVLVFFLAAAP